MTLHTSMKYSALALASLLLLIPFESCRLDSTKPQSVEQQPRDIEMSTQQNLKEIEGTQFLDELESVYNSNGINAVVELVKRSFSIDELVDLKQIPSERRVHRICDRAVWRTDSQGEITGSPLLALSDSGSESCSIIRVFSIPYVAEPFQVELYGEEIDVDGLGG